MANNFDNDQEEHSRKYEKSRKKCVITLAIKKDNS